MSELDGKTVTFRDNKEFVGVVQGDSYIPGTVRVEWSEPTHFTSPADLTHLVVVDDAV